MATCLLPPEINDSFLLGCEWQSYLCWFAEKPPKNPIYDHYVHLSAYLHWSGEGPVPPSQRRSPGQTLQQAHPTLQHQFLFAHSAGWAVSPTGSLVTTCFNQPLMCLAWFSAAWCSLWAQLTLFMFCLEVQGTLVSSQSSDTPTSALTSLPQSKWLIYSATAVSEFSLTLSYFFFCYSQHFGDWNLCK